MLVNKATIDAVFTNIRTEFNNIFQSTPSSWERIATLITSGTSVEEYDWLSDFPMMREWIGDKVIKQLAAFKYSIRNKAFEATIGVRRDDMEDDKLVNTPPKPGRLDGLPKVWPDRLVFALVNAGFTGIGFDGQYFFDTDHSVAGASVSNKSTAVLSVTTKALADAGYGAARIAMMTITNDEGEPLDITPNLLVPPALENTAKTLMTADKLEDDKPNSYKNTAEVLVSPRITSATSWFLFDTTKPLKPFIFQQRKAPMPVQQTDPQADDVFMRAEYKFGVEARGNAGYGLWQLAHGSTGAG